MLTLAFPPVKRAIPGVRLRPAGEAAFRPPGARGEGAGEGAEGAAFVRPMILDFGRRTSFSLALWERDKVRATP